MRTEFNKIRGRVGVVATLLLILAALALYFYSERAVPPETELEAPSRAESGDRPTRSDAVEAPTSADEASAGSAFEESARADGGRLNADEPALPRPAEPETGTEAEISLERQQQLLREDLALRLGPGQLEMIADERLIERLVTTFNSLDGPPVPLRFRPLAHVPGLPRLERDGDAWRLLDTPDPRYRPYRAMFDRLSAVEIVEMFERYEPALEKAWQSLGQHTGQTFRERSIEILAHLAEFELPASRPALHQPKVLYEYIDPSLEQLSWGRKILVRIGPEHAPPVQQKLSAVAERLASPSG